MQAEFDRWAKQAAAGLAQVPEMMAGLGETLARMAAVLEEHRPAIERLVAEVAEHERSTLAFMEDQMDY